MNLINKNVVYVGGFGGIGFATCKQFLLNGIANLVILDVNLNEKYLQQLQNDFPKVNIIFLRVDLRNKSNIEESFKEIIEKIEYIDILVNGSGVGDESNPEQIIDINLTGLINTCLIAIPYMDKSSSGKDGMIVNIASVLGFVPCAQLLVYTASKHGVIGFTRSLADNFYYERTGIAVIAICPGLTDTPLVKTNGKTNVTLPYGTEIKPKIGTGKKQSVEECAKNIIKGIELNKNGSIWILDLGQRFLNFLIFVPLGKILKVWRTTKNNFIIHMKNKKDL